MENRLMSNPRACQPLKVKALAPVVRDLTPEYEGPYTIEPSSQSSVVVPVQGKKMTQDLTVERATLEELNVSITENGETRIEAEEGYLGLSAVNLTTNVQPALQTKSVEYTANGSYEVTADTEYYGLEKVNVTVNTDVPYQESDVEFLDYDGTIVYSYTKEQFLALDSMPPNPSHAGLTAQGWNWNLSDAKEYVSECGKIDIGQSYITDNGKTRIYVSFGERRSPTLGIGINGTADIDWGDGSEHSTVTGTNKRSKKYIAHEYANPGNYIIQISIDGEGTIGSRLGSNNTTILCHDSTSGDDIRNAYYKNAIKKIEIGANIVSLEGYAFFNLNELEFVTIPITVTSIDNQSAFSNTYKLAYLILPFSFSIYASSFEYSCLNRIIFGQNNTLNSFGLASSYLVRFIIPKSATSLPYACMRYNISLSEIIIPKNITTISNSALAYTPYKKIKFVSLTPPTVSAYDAFSNLPTDCKIYVPYSEDHSILTAYTTATNYPSSSTYTYVEY